MRDTSPGISRGIPANADRAAKLPALLHGHDLMPGIPPAHLLRRGGQGLDRVGLKRMAEDHLHPHGLD
jgi:hypothetical protein